MIVWFGAACPKNFCAKQLRDCLKQTVPDCQITRLRFHLTGFFDSLKPAFQLPEKQVFENLSASLQSDACVD